MAFSTCGVDNAIENTSGDGNAKSLPHVGSTAPWERRMALAADVTPVVAENCSREFGLHGDSIFYFYVMKRHLSLPLLPGSLVFLHFYLLLPL